MSDHGVLLDPQIVGRAESAHKPLLERILTESMMTKIEWVTLTLLIAGHPAVEGAELLARVTGALKIDRTAASDALASLQSAGLVSTDFGRVRANDDGRARFASIRSGIDAVVVRAYGGIPIEDLATAARVLIHITSRLDAEAETAR